MKQIYTGEIGKHTSWDGDESTENLPVAGSSIETFIKETFGQKAGDFHYDADSNKYLVFADEEERELYLSNRETYASLLLGSFDAPAPYSAEIRMQTPSSNIVLAGSTGHYIDFTFDVLNRTGSSTGESVVATYTFNNGGNVKKLTQVYAAATNVHFLIDSYLTVGNNQITVVITGRNSLVSTMASVNYTVVSLNLSSDFDFSKAVEKGLNLEIPYRIQGAHLKYIEWYIDGVVQLAVDTVSGLDVELVKNLDTSDFQPGKHSIQARAYIVDNETNYYSNTIYFNFVISPVGGIWSDDTVYALLGLNLSAPATSGISINIKQYDTLNYKAAVYDNRSRSNNFIVQDNNVQVQALIIEPQEVETLSYTPTTVGSHTLTFTAGEDTVTVSALVEASEINIQEETAGLLLKLSAKGRSNSEAEPDTWEYNNIETTFNNIAWNTQSGWNNDALIIPSGSSINIDLAPLSGDVITPGRTIELDFETFNITNEDADILKIVDITTGAGLNIKASSAELKSAGGRSVKTRYKDGDRMHMTFIINRVGGNDPRMMYIVNNGILERAAQFTQNDTFTVADTITIGSNGCGIKLYGIRVYNKALTVDLAFCNYAVDSPDLLNIAAKNDIYNSVSNAIDVDKVNAYIPVMIITGDISYILSINDKSHKGDWNTYPVQIEYRNMQNPELNFFIDNADIRLQGTSSISYPRKNFRIYSKSKSKKYNTKMYSPTHNSEDLVAGGKYSFKEGSAPVTCWCLKADYAESSGSHNTGIAKLWNQLMYNTTLNGNHVLRTEAQNWAAEHGYQYDVRTTIDGFPIVLFQRDDENAPLTCLGQYNFNNDKSTEDVFGFTALEVEDGEGNTETFDNSHVLCWEVLDSDNSIALFTDVSQFDSKWGDAFEARYPGDSTNVTALKRVAEWLNSCYLGMQDDEMLLDMTEWNSHKADYFDLPKLAAYYVYLLRFGAVDQTVKNAMFTTEDGEHWFYINYDNDTVLGIDNSSRIFDTWDYDLKTKTPNGGYYYAGKGMSVLWNLFEADSDCIALARQLDERLYQAGLNYNKLCEIFDDEQSSKWCQRIYNENGRYKYVDSFLNGYEYLYMLQGSRESYRHWWIQHRFEKYDNEFGNGTYNTRSILARATGTVNIPQGAAYKFTPAIDSKFGYSVASTEVDGPTARTHDVEYTATGLPSNTGVGNLIYIYNANNLKAIDVSAYINALGYFDVSAAVDVNGGSNLKSIKLGDGENTNAYLEAISGLDRQSGIEEIDIRGYQGITSLGLNNLYDLKVFKAANSGLTSFEPAAGIRLTNVSLPSSLQVLSLDSVTLYSGDIFDYTPTLNLRYLSFKNIANMRNLDVKTFTINWIDGLTPTQRLNATLIITGIDWHTITVQQLLKFATIGNLTLRGRVTLNSLTYLQYQLIVEAFGPNVFDPNGSFVVDAPAGSIIDGPSSLRAGASGQFTAIKFPIAETTKTFLMYQNNQLVPSSTDEQDRVYRQYNSIRLYEATGAIEVLSDISSNTEVQVKALFDGTVYTDAVTFTGVPVTYPTGATITGLQNINSLVVTQYIVSFTGTYNASLQNIAWSATNLTGIGTLTPITGDNRAEIQITSVPATPVTVRLTCTATFEGNQTVSQYIDITVGLNLPNTMAITGPDTIDDNDDYSYQVTFNGSQYDSSSTTYTARITSISWTLSLNAPAGVTTGNEDEYGCDVTASQGNDSLVTVTLTCTATFSGDRTMTATKSIVVTIFDPPVTPSTEDWVDLGLPSGLLWCNHNVGATNPEDSGLYFSWGNTEGHAEGSGYSFDNTTYDSTPGGGISGLNPHDSFGQAYDAAHAILGGSWRMPTDAEFKELYDNTDNLWTTVNGVNGRKFMKKTDHSVYVFFPAAGNYDGTSLNNSGLAGFYWSSSWYYNTQRYGLYFVSSSALPQYTTFGYGGFQVRAVRMAPKTVDLGLPSGTLWADRNVGATSPEDSGLYFAWGETEGYADATDRDTKLTAETGTTYTGGFDLTSYNRTGGASSISGNLSGSNDAATVNLGGSWRMPTKEETQELYDNTDSEWTTIDGMNGWKFMKKSDHSVFIFLPAANYYNGTSLGASVSIGDYRTASFSSSSLAYCLLFNSSNVYPQSNGGRSSGLSVRAVQ